jgi:hypothetical protein
MIELDISAIDLDEKENRVYVYLENIDDVKLNRIKAVIDSPAIEFKEHKLKVQF